MWNKHFRILWLKIQVGKNTHWGLPFPIPMYIFQELLDCTSDLLTVICLFTPKSTQTVTSPSFGIYAIKELIDITMNLLDSLTQDEPYDLVDIKTANASVFIKIR